MTEIVVIQGIIVEFEGDPLVAAVRAVEFLDRFCARHAPTDEETDGQQPDSQQEPEDVQDLRGAKTSVTAEIEHEAR